MDDLYAYYMVIVIAVVTAMLRFLPFILFNEKRQTPRIIEKLGMILPFSIMGMLVVYCLKDITFISLSGFLPHIISCIIVAIIHIWKRNTLFSIICGTACYMFLVQAIF